MNAFTLIQSPTPPSPSSTLPSTQSPQRPSPITSLSDDELMERVLRGDRAAHGELYRRQAKPMTQLARRMLKNADDADEIVQEAFLVVLRGAARVPPAKGRVAAWMATIVKNLVCERRRKRRGERLIDPIEGRGTFDPFGEDDVEPEET